MSLKSKLNLGATGAFPDGKLNRHDQGQIRLAVSHGGGLVRLDFGKPITWLAFRPDEAKELAALILQHASGGVSQ